MLSKDSYTPSTLGQCGYYPVCPVMERLTKWHPLLGWRDFNLCQLWSFDLKSATDRWPLLVIYTLFECLFGPTFASSVVKGSLALNSFFVWKPLVKRPYLVSFVAGQPKGYYGSWALFSLSLYCVVGSWVIIFPSHGPFTRYAVLGDDVVIADTPVAEAYRGLLDKLGVSICLFSLKLEL